MNVRIDRTTHTRARATNASDGNARRSIHRVFVTRSTTTVWPVVAASHDEDASLRFFRDNGEQHTRRTTTTMPPPPDDDDEMVRTLARARTSRRASSPSSSSSPIVGFSVGKAPSAVGHQFAYGLALVRHDANADSWVDIDGVVNGKGIVGYEGLYPATAMERFQLVVALMRDACGRAENDATGESPRFFEREATSVLLRQDYSRPEFLVSGFHFRERDYGGALLPRPVRLVWCDGLASSITAHDFLALMDYKRRHWDADADARLRARLRAEAEVYMAPPSSRRIGWLRPDGSVSAKVTRVPEGKRLSHGHKVPTLSEDAASIELVDAPSPTPDLIPVLASTPDPVPVPAPTDVVTPGVKVPKKRRRSMCSKPKDDKDDGKRFKTSPTRTMDDSALKRPPRIELPPFYDSKTFALKAGPPEYDSDIEGAIEADIHDDARCINDYVDFAASELEFMKKWNTLARQFRCVADYDVPALCKAFVRRHSRDLRDTTFYDYFTRTLLGMYEFGCIDRIAVVETLRDASKSAKEK